jgi:hypothetical protein
VHLLVPACVVLPPLRQEYLAETVQAPQLIIQGWDGGEGPFSHNCGVWYRLQRISLWE